MRPIKPYDLVVTPDNYLALVLAIQNSSVLVLAGNGLFRNFPLDSMEGVAFTPGVGEPTSFAEAFTRLPDATIRKPSIHRT